MLVLAQHTQAGRDRHTCHKMGWSQTSPAPGNNVEAVRVGLGALLQEPHLAAYCTDDIIRK